MEPELKQEERELIKLVHFFKKRAQLLMEENKLEEGYSKLIETCDTLVAQLHIHASNRQTVLKEREQLKNMVRDNAVCPKCNTGDMLKMTGVDTSAEGWKSNKYKCRRCNIEFVWNAPNNPWDMIPYVENFVVALETKLTNENHDEASREHATKALAIMRTNLATLKPVVEASDLDFSELNEREKEMEDLVHRFKKQLQIEKIRIED